MYNTKIISKEEDFVGLREEWNDLLDKSKFNYIFLTHEWLSAWWEDYGKNHKLFIVLVKKENEIKAIAPLMITDNKKLQFIGHDVSDYLDFIIKDHFEECFQLIFNEINENQKLWDWVEFVYIQQDSPFYDLWQKNLSRMKTIKHEIKRDCASVYLDLYKNGGNWESLEKTLPPKRRNDLKRCRRLLDEKGKTSFQRLSQLPEIETVFEHFVANHKRRWKEDRQGSQFDSDLQIKHYLNIARKLAPNGWVELSCLKLDGDYVAMAFGYLYNERYYYYTPTFNPDYWRYSPGNLLIKFLIEEFYDGGEIKIFDLLRGEEKYKYIWTKDELALCRIKIYPFKVRSLLIYITDTIISYILPRLQKYPVLRKLKHLLLKPIKGLRG